MKQTAVEWLVEQICGDHTSEWQEQIEQAKAMEWEQIINAYDQGCEAGYELAKNDDFIKGVSFYLFK